MNISFNRFTVASALFENAKGDKKKYIILDKGIPTTEINKHLIVQQEKYARPVSTGAYNLCLFFNSMEDYGIDVFHVTMNDIYNYLFSAYIDDCKSYHTVKSYIFSISALYESLARRGIELDESLYHPDYRLSLFPSAGTKVLTSNKDKLTKVYALKYEFCPRKDDASESNYTKWYAPEEITIISEELPITYRCIFLDTIYTGHRVDSALSITLDTVSLKDKQVWPTRTKTGKTHISLIPPKLCELMQTYLVEVRSNIVNKTGSTSNFFFLGRNGLPVTYGAFDKAIKAAHARILKKNPYIHLNKLHTHAGRSTFAATLRTYQLNQQRKGIPTFTDTDFCNLMDWKSLQCLENYDIATRAQEVSPLLEEYFSNYLNSNYKKGE